EQDDKGWDARKRAYCLKIQPATGSFARNLIYSTKPFPAYQNHLFLSDYLRYCASWCSFLISILAIRTPPTSCPLKSFTMTHIEIVVEVSALTNF
ncbi:hypothetical protein, partial [Klebsiella pneumoniae]|uniref:hypothetical protein n=1 Tax=Klebsiella pneumoniae TaxID=573 RepID=UPI0021E78D5D